jgi:hypothetical protein
MAGGIRSFSAGRKLKQFTDRSEPPLLGPRPQQSELTSRPVESALVCARAHSAEKAPRAPSAVSKKHHTKSALLHYTTLRVRPTGALLLMEKHSHATVPDRQIIERSGYRRSQIDSRCLISYPRCPALLLRAAARNAFTKGCLSDAFVDYVGTLF